MPHPYALYFLLTFASVFLISAILLCFECIHFKTHKGYITSIYISSKAFWKHNNALNHMNCVYEFNKLLNHYAKNASTPYTKMPYEVSKNQLYNTNALAVFVILSVLRKCL